MGDPDRTPEESHIMACDGDQTDAFMASASVSQGRRSTRYTIYAKPMKKPSRPLIVLGVLLVLLPLANLAQALSKKEAEQAGAALFRDKGCAYCHGAAAQGTQKGPSLANVRQKLKASQIADQIENGGQKMPSFKEAVSNEEVAELVAYLRAKHRPVPAPIPAPAQTPAPVINPGQ
jgi:mono/diheme cytochrome c family protein